MSDIPWIDAVADHSTFGKNRHRLPEQDVTLELFNETVEAT
ncbi:transposase [Paraburkholderia pallida]|nr:transposase [Paraburkholderia pallida]